MAGSNGAPWEGLLGLATALLALTSPQFLFVCPLLLLVLSMRLGQRQWRTVAAFALAAALPLLSWMQFQKSKKGEYGMGALMGYHLSNISGGIMELELAPAKYAVERIVDTIAILALRAALQARRGVVPSAPMQCGARRPWKGLVPAPPVSLAAAGLLRAGSLGGAGAGERSRSRKGRRARRRRGAGTSERGEGA